LNGRSVLRVFGISREINQSLGWLGWLGWLAGLAGLAMAGGTQLLGFLCFQGAEYQDNSEQSMDKTLSFCGKCSGGEEISKHNKNMNLSVSPSLSLSPSSLSLRAVQGDPQKILCCTSLAPGGSWGPRAMGGHPPQSNVVSCFC
jgi:hypothetical protein